MAEPTKSVLFVDYDSLRRSLTKVDAVAAERLAERIASWVNAIEAGRLAPAHDGKRRVLMRRCYADPAALADKRSQFTGNGFQVVDCLPLEGRERNAADIHIALDTIDALGHPTAYDEFILLSADSDFSPLLIRLRAHNRQTIIYANAGTAAGYKTIADGLVDEDAFAAFLTSTDEPKPAEPIAVRAPAGVGTPAEVPLADRTEIEALARKVHAATNVPLFSPRSYLELFRFLAEEIRESGYHFQATAENVAAKLTASGRNATRRQIVFIVKGLALKGHVFSNNDKPEHLADVFREQVSYLIRNAGLELTLREAAILPAWIIGRAGPTASADIEAEPLATAKPPEEEPAPKSQVDKVAAKPFVEPKSAKRFTKPNPPVRNETPPATPAARPPPLDARPGEAAAKPPGSVRISVPPRPTTLKTSKPSILASGTRPGSAVSGNAARPMALTGTAKAPGGGAARPAVTPASRPAATKPLVERPATERTTTADKEAVESTILAAIAQAVDVLVEDRGPGKSAKVAEPASEEQPPSKPAVESEVPSGDSGDIGDEIQRIIASYNRDRQQSDRE